MYAPVIPLSGIAGWQLLQRTQDKQIEAFSSSAEIQRNSADFRERISEVKSAEDLVGDYRLLNVALGAFGLSDDIANRYFIQKVLEEGTLDPAAFANRLSDNRYEDLSKAFGFGDFDTPNTVLSDFPDRIIDAYTTRAFETAVGEQDTDLQLAMNIQRELPEIAADDAEEDTLWFRVMGNEPLRAVFEKALNLPPEFAAIDIDKQLETFKDRAGSLFGDTSVSQFTDPDKMEELTRRFLVMSQLDGDNTSFNSNNAALTILSGVSSSNIFELLT